MKLFKVTAEVNYCAEKHESVWVKANTARKAEIKAKERFENNGFFGVRIIDIEEVPA